MHMLLPTNTGDKHIFIRFLLKEIKGVISACKFFAKVHRKNTYCFFVPEAGHDRASIILQHKLQH